MRKFSWFIIVINVLFLIWIIAGANSGGGAANCGSLSVQTCQDAQTVGKGIGVMLIVGFWVAADVILGILWLVTGGKKTKTKETIVYRDAPAA